VISLLITIIYAAYARSKKLSFEKTRLLSLVSLIFVHLQFLVGLVLYFISPKVIFSGQAMKAPLTRFFLVEHLTGMLIGITLITIGYSVSKKALTVPKQYNKLLIYYLIGFLIILVAVPWPFYNFGTGWL
jgi:hypothetical protein